jgi:hypothetical protein
MDEAHLRYHDSPPWKTMKAAVRDLMKLRATPWTLSLSMQERRRSFW